MHEVLFTCAHGGEDQKLEIQQRSVMEFGWDFEQVMEDRRSEPAHTNENPLTLTKKDDLMGSFSEE